MEDDSARSSQRVTIGGDDETKRRAPVDLQRVLLDVSRLAASRCDLDGLLGELVVVLQKAFRFDGLAVVLHDPARREMVLRFAGGSARPGKPIATAQEDDAAGLAWLTQQPIFVPDVERETRFPEIIEVARSYGTRSFCVFPLTSPVRRLGAFGFTSRETDAFHDVDPEFLQQLTDEVALAVDNALHHESAEEAERRLRQEHDRLRTLLEINNALVSNLDPTALFGDIAACLRRVVAHDLTALVIHDAQRNGFRVAAVAFENKEAVREGEFFPMDDVGNPATAAFRTGTPLRVGRDVIATLGARNRPLLTELGVESACLLPMSARGRRVGTIVVGRLRGEPFSDDDVAILAAAAGQIAFAVANALAFDEIATLRDKLAVEKVYLEDELRSHYDFEEIVGESPVLKAVLAQVETVGPTSSTVLILGETGTGKGLVAQAIHAHSPRGAPFRPFGCVAIPTPARERALRPRARRLHRRRRETMGRFELADGERFSSTRSGTCRLAQAKVLRLLQAQGFQRVGGRGRSVPTCASSQRRNEALARSSPRAVPRRPLLPAQRTRSRFPRCASGATTSLTGALLPAAFRRGMNKMSTRSRDALTRSRPTTGPATCASSRM